MSHSKLHIRGPSSIQAILNRAHSSQETALFAVVPLLKVVSEKTWNIMEAVQNVKDNKAEQGLVIKVTASIEAFCNSYHYSVRQANWPSNGVKALLHVLSDALEEIEQYIMEQIEKSRVVRFFNSTSNIAKIKMFLRRLENIINKLEHLDNVSESVIIALKDSLHNIRPLMPTGPSPNIPEEVRVNECTFANQGRRASTSMDPSSCSSRETSGPFTNTATESSRVHPNEYMFSSRIPQHGLGTTSSVPSLGIPDDSQASNSSPLPTSHIYSVGDTVPRGTESSLNHSSPTNQAPLMTSLLPDQRNLPPLPFPLPHPTPWVLGPPLITINISNIGNSNDTTTIQ